MMKIRIGKKKHACAESKKPQTLLRELTEDELERALAAVEEIDPDELAFNQIFGDKKRLVIDLDGTLTLADTSDYRNVSPNLPLIEKLRECILFVIYGYDQGIGHS